MALDFHILVEQNSFKLISGKMLDVFYSYDLNVFTTRTMYSLHIGHWESGLAHFRHVAMCPHSSITQSMGLSKQILQSSESSIVSLSISSFCFWFHIRLARLSSSSFSVTPLKLTLFVARRYFNCRTVNPEISVKLLISASWMRMFSVVGDTTSSEVVDRVFCRGRAALLQDALCSPPCAILHPDCWARPATVDSCAPSFRTYGSAITHLNLEMLHFLFLL